MVWALPRRKAGSHLDGSTRTNTPSTIIQRCCRRARRGLACPAPRRVLRRVLVGGDFGRDRPVDRKVPATRMSTHTITEAEFARRFQEHWRALWCVAVAVLGNRTEADDVLQDSAITGLHKRADFADGSSFVHWMSQIVRYTALNEGRRRQRRAHVDYSGAVEQADRSPHHSPLEIVEPFDDQLLAALATLDETARVCLLMRTVLDLPYRQIAEALQIAEGTAMSHVHRSRNRLRTALLAAQHSAGRPTTKTGGA